MNKVRLLVLALLLGTGTAPLVGCDEGPLEEAGEEIDEAVDEIEDEL